MRRMYDTCPDRNRKRMKRVTLIYLRKQLLYDIENCAYVEGDVMQTEDGHNRHQVMDVGQDGNVDRVTRVLDLAFGECMDMLYPYSKREVECGMQQDDMLVDTEEYVMELHVPEDFSVTTVDYLRTLVHEYLVCRVLADWMGMTNPGSRAGWEVKAEDMKEKIWQCMNVRMGRVRRTLSPF